MTFCTFLRALLMLFKKKNTQWFVNMKCVMVTSKDWQVESFLLSGSFVLRVCFGNEFD